MCIRSHWSASPNTVWLGQRLFSPGNYRSLQSLIIIIGLTSRRPALVYSIRFPTLSVIPFATDTYSYGRGRSRSCVQSLLLQRDDRFRHNGTLVPRGSPVFNHTERFFGQGRWCPWLFLIVINDKKKRPAPGCSSRCAQSMPDVADRYINCVHGNSRTKLAMD